MEYDDFRGKILIDQEELEMIFSCIAVDIERSKLLSSEQKDEVTSLILPYLEDLLGSK